MSSEGVPCPQCDGRNSLVTDSRGREKGRTYRRRKCTTCSTKFSTIELSEADFQALLRAQAIADAFAVIVQKVQEPDAGEVS